MRLPFHRIFDTSYLDIVKFESCFVLRELLLIEFVIGLNEGQIVVIGTIEKQHGLFILIVPSELDLELALAVREGMLEVPWLIHVVPLLQQFVAQVNSYDTCAPLLLKGNGCLNALYEGLVRPSPT